MVIMELIQVRLSVTVGPTPTIATFCTCGETQMGIQTTTNAEGTGFVECGTSTMSTIAPTHTAPPKPLTCNGPGGTDWNGDGRIPFDRTVGYEHPLFLPFSFKTVIDNLSHRIFALNHLYGTDRPEYTSDPSKMPGYAGDRFWFDKNGNFVMSTNYKTADGWWPKEMDPKNMGEVLDIWLNVEFSSDQTGCQPTKKFDIPSGTECRDMFYAMMDDCDTGTTTQKNGGLYHINGPNGCVDYRMWANK